MRVAGLAGDNYMTNVREMKSGIYRIKNLETGVMYIGRTAESFASRWGKHRRTLKAGHHDNEHLQRSYDKHGKDAFEYKVLEVIPQGDMTDQEFTDYLNEREIILIDEHDTHQNGYNQTDGGGGLIGHEFSEEHRAKMSRALKGNTNSLGHKPTAETRAKLSKAHKGRALSVEHKANISKAKKGRKLTPEHRANLSKANMGYKHTAEARANMSKAQKGKKHPWRTGKKLTPEHRTKLSKAHKGKPWTEARRAAYEARCSS